MTARVVVVENTSKGSLMLRPANSTALLWGREASQTPPAALMWMEVREAILNLAAPDSALVTSSLLKVEAVAPLASLPALDTRMAEPEALGQQRPNSAHLENPVLLTK